MRVGTTSDTTVSSRSHNATAASDLDDLEVRSVEPDIELVWEKQAPPLARQPTMRDRPGARPLANSPHGRAKPLRYLLHGQIWRRQRPDLGMANPLAPTKTLQTASCAYA